MSGRGRTVALALRFALWPALISALVLLAAFTPPRRLRSMVLPAPLLTLITLLLGLWAAAHALAALEAAWLAWRGRNVDTGVLHRLLDVRPRTRGVGLPGRSVAERLRASQERP